MVSMRTFSPSMKETRIAFFPKVSIFFPPKLNNEFPTGSNVRLSRFIYMKGLMNKMLAELPLSMRMLCIVNLTIFVVATKASVCGKSHTWKSFSSKVIGTMDQAGLLSGSLGDTVCTLLSKSLLALLFSCS